MYVMQFCLPIYKYKAPLLLGVCICFLFIMFSVFAVKQETQVLPEIENQPDHFFVDEKSQNYFKTNPPFPDLREYLENLADEKGAVYALNTLIYGELPKDIDTHLMGHYVARKLYKEKGVNGLDECGNNLGYACAHVMVTESLYEKGMTFFDEVNGICARAKGSGAYFMCFHGFGHGVLAFADYELPKAIELCGKVGTEAYSNYEAVECVGGAIMEMRGGIHDPHLWERNGKKYLNEKNPTDLCLSDFLDEKYRYICFVYITPFIFDSLGAHDIPTFEEYGPAIRSCDVLTKPEYREACFGGFAKEFVGFLFGRDIRKISDITDEQLSEVFSDCSLAGAEDGVAGCVKHTILDLLGRGRYAFEIAGRFCELVDRQYSDYCVSSFIRAIGEQNKLSPEQRKEFCTYVEEKFQRSCERW